jgi:hypothetical protein
VRIEEFARTFSPAKSVTDSVKEGRFRAESTKGLEN